MTKNKAQTHQMARSSYQLKRLSHKWKERKKNAKEERMKKVIARRIYIKQPYENHPAPLNMSFIDNTDEVLKYFQEARDMFKSKKKVEFDIKKITNLTLDAITIMVAKLKDPQYIYGGKYKGCAPYNKELNLLFMESGFYNFVATKSRNKHLGDNLLHKETDYKVRPDIAQSACKKGMEHALKTSIPFEPLYEILVECMQNTHNHATYKGTRKCKWWLSVYNDKKTGTSKYSFLDLGVGIFESIKIKGFIRETKQKMGFLKNEDLVQDLLSGKIGSRMEIDNHIRGKGIPQIAEHAKLPKFKTFIIIANNIKINLKDSTHIKLKNDFSGTFYYWELQQDIDEN